MQQNKDTRLSEDGGLAPYDTEPSDCENIHNLQIRGK
eukprot:SAG31_NODE_24172_length_487_cov_1.175258_2_plen_36_part_01